MKKAAIKIGDMRHRITFQSGAEIEDEHHGHTIQWNNIATVWAKVDPVSGNEFYYSQQLKNTITHKITIRYRNDINVEMRIIFETRVMKIESMINLEEGNRFILLRCEEEMK